MREIELRVTKINLKDITGEDKEIDFDYKFNMIEVLNSPLEMGMSLEDVEKRLNLRKKIKDADKILKLEESEYEYLKKLVIEEKWKIVDQSIIDYVNDIKNAKQVN